MLGHWRVLLVLVPAVATAQQPGTAGEKRPKLEVLQSLPEAQLFPVMNLVATSLGVQCTYCHVQATPDFSRTPLNMGGWAWDRDDKPTKRKAREMMKMVVELNASRFRGETKITCYTCHRGTTQPSRLPPLPSPLPGWERPTTPTTPTTLPPAERVVAAYIAAVRGDATARGSAMVMRGWDDRPEGRYARLEIAVAGTDRYRLTLTTPTDTTRQGMDEEGPWVVTNGRVQRLASAADVARMRRVAMRYRPVKEQPPNLRTVAVERVDDRDAYVLQAKLDSVTTRTAYFDVVTGLLRRELTTTETMLLPLEEQIDYDDYRDVSGLLLPFRVRFSEGAAYTITTRTILEIRRNLPTADSLFRPPPPPSR